MHFIQLRENYKELRYESYKAQWQGNALAIQFCYRLVQEAGEDIVFNHSLTYELMENGKPVAMPCEKEKWEKLDNFIFQIGVAESINYWKLACPSKLVIACGYLDKPAIAFWKKLYYNGLGEFIYLNGIHRLTPEINEDTLLEIIIESDKTFSLLDGQDYRGTLIPVGGGKDSVVTLELLRTTKEWNLPFVMSPPQAAYDCIEVAGYSQYLLATRTLDSQILTMNQRGYLNGHVPFSAILAFISALGAVLVGKRYIALSNEKSANEPSVPDTHFNHQYSKTLEFEQDVTAYFQTYLMKEIKYFSLLRPLYEIEIGHAFSRYEEYHSVFRSCNRGKKQNMWCGECSKCLFVYIILAPYIEREKLAAIFGKDLWQDSSLQPILEELLGLTENKPFECVGTVWEVRFALAETVKRYDYTLENAPALIRFFLEKALPEAKPDENYESGDCIPEEFRGFLKELV